MDEDEATRLLRLLEEAKTQLSQERQRREEADRQREEANRQRENAEAAASAARPQTVPDYLAACHQLSLGIDIVTDKSLTTQGEPTKPAGRKFPQQIIPWDNFAATQEETWNQLAADNAFFTDTIYPSANQVDYIASLNRPISSELDLRNFERDTVENAVQRLLDGVYQSERLRNDLNMQGTVVFKNHTNLGSNEESVSESLEGLTIQATVTADAPRRRAKGRGNRRADQFCIYRENNGRSHPSLAIEYKPPHKLSRDQILAGLGREIRPQHDVINAEGEGFEFESKRLCAAVITQLFSYMVGLGTSYGYVCTGEVFIFLHIPAENPSIVYYAMQVPNLDVVEDDETRLHRTAVAQVFAFVLRAAREEPLPQSWFDAAERLGTWAVEYEKILEDVPVSARKPQHETPYKPQRWKGQWVTILRINTKATNRTARHQRQIGQPRARELQGHRKEPMQEVAKKSKDEAIGNKTYGNVRFALTNVFADWLLEVQWTKIARTSWTMDEVTLTLDRGRDSNCIPLGLSGLHGSLFKVCLATHGYTFVAKGVEEVDASILRHEARIYDELRAIQGTYVPVSLGVLNLALPYYFDGRVCASFLFLSYAGRPLNHIIDTLQPEIVANVSLALTAIHERGVHHRDAEPRNLLCDGNTIMVVDFEKAHIYERPVLKAIGPNGNSRKRKRNSKQCVESQLLQELENTRRSVTRILEQRGRMRT
ncbi:hypothetical protein PCL_07062 [Purpureocillium lilacinum]|uniref:Protein kinase domain-containing protein n=1 Tax=Purpureocillium lilacinum TaxID=33203 RepID=A0A2U3DT81_PURLI|nr:hypothetical protein PCL_07062 [Purpureocillium lilacinum]